MNKFKRFLVLIIISYPMTLLSQYSIKKNNLTETPLFLEFKVGNKIYFGSGFSIRNKTDKGDYIHIVTARHVIGKLDAQNRLVLKESTLYVSSIKDVYSNSISKVSINLKQMLDANLINYSLTHDVVIIPIFKIVDNKIFHVTESDFKQVSGNEDFFWRYISKNQFNELKNVTIGNDCFLLGYPKTLGLKRVPQYDYNKPLLRKGVIAGTYIKNKTIILDCRSDKGNSGGPVYEVDSKSKKIKLIGLVSQYIPKNDTSIHDNSEYSVIVSTDVISELLKVYQ